MDNNAVKKNWDYYRLQKGLKIEDLAARLGGPRQKIYNYFSSASGLTLATLERLAALVEVEPWQLLAGPEVTPPTTDGTPAPPPAPAITCPHCGRRLRLVVSLTDDHTPRRVTDVSTIGHTTTTDTQSSAAGSSPDHDHNRERLNA